MKLRNKKTGDTVEGYVMVGVQNNEKFPNPIEYHTYISLAELKEEWEDYEPVEPIIEDHKIRKVFREWADLFGAKRFRVDQLCNFGRTIFTSIDLVCRRTGNWASGLLRDRFRNLYQRRDLWRGGMKAKTLSKQDLARPKDCVKTTIAGRVKAIQSGIDSFSSQFCWSIAEEMGDDFELLNKLEELLEEEE